MVDDVAVALEKQFVEDGCEHRKSMCIDKQHDLLLRSASSSVGDSNSGPMHKQVWR